MDSKVKNKETSQKTRNIVGEADTVDMPGSLDKGTVATSEDSSIMDSVDNNSNGGDCKDQNLVDKWQGTDKKSGERGCLRVNENSNNGSGALRYALHLRFICPVPKSSRSSQKCKSDPLSKPERKGLDSDGERRFYLYNDLRVVFPQRHSDDDEGKVMRPYLFWRQAIFVTLSSLRFIVFCFYSGQVTNLTDGSQCADNQKVCCCSLVTK